MATIISTDGNDNLNGGSGADGLLILTYGGTYTLVASISAGGGLDPYSTTVPQASYPAGMKLYRPDLIGFVGGYYEEFTLSNQTVATATDVQASSLTRTQTYTDFSGVMATGTGVWTCPHDGVYTFTFKVTLSAFVSGSNFRLSIQNSSGLNIAHINAQPNGTTNVQESVSCTKYVTAGDTITFIVRQVTGANQTINGTASYISVMRMS